MSGSTRSTENMRLVATSCDGRERMGPDLELRCLPPDAGPPHTHPAQRLLPLPQTPGLPGPEAHLLPQVLLKLLLGSLHRPKVVQLGSHLSTAKPGCLPPFPRWALPGPPLHLGEPGSPPTRVLPVAPYLIRRGAPRPRPAHPAREVLRRQRRGVRGGGGQRVSWGSGELSHLDFLSQLLPREQASVPPGRGAPLAPVALAAALGMQGGRAQHIGHVGAEVASIIICV